MKGILKLDINKNYTCTILGLGEIFEIISVEHRRKKLRSKYGNGFLYLSSNSDHSGRGFKKEQLEEEINNDNLKLIESGYADAPPWKSDPAEEGTTTAKMNIPLMPLIGRILFHIWIPLFEGFYRKREIAHVTWAFGKKD